MRLDVGGTGQGRISDVELDVRGTGLGVLDVGLDVRGTGLGILGVGLDGAPPRTLRLRACRTHAHTQVVCVSVASPKYYIVIQFVSQYHRVWLSGKRAYFSLQKNGVLVDLEPSTLL